MHKITHDRNTKKSFENMIKIWKFSFIKKKILIQHQTFHHLVAHWILYYILLMQDDDDELEEEETTKKNLTSSHHFGVERRVVEIISRFNFTKSYGNWVKMLMKLSI